MRNYEIMFIVSTQLTEEEKQVGIKYVEDTLKASGAEPVTTEILGDKKLAYPIEKKENGYYVLTTFEIDGTRLIEVEGKLNINENLMKYMIVKND